MTRLSSVPYQYVLERSEAFLAPHAGISGLPPLLR